MTLETFKKLILINGMDTRMEGVYLEEQETTRYFWVSKITEDKIIFIGETDEPMTIMDIVNTEGEGEREVIIELHNLHSYIPIEITGFYIDEVNDLMVNYKLKEEEGK